MVQSNNHNSHHTHAAHAGPTHAFHLVDPSPWPATASLAVRVTFLGMVRYFHSYAGAGTVLSFGFCFLLYTAWLWWRDIFRESALGYHTAQVQRGIQYGMLWFISTEAMFFVGLIWAFLNAALMPTVHIGQVWPPEGIVPVDWAGRPALNTVLLAASYFSANVAKYAMEQNKRDQCRTHLIITVALGALFLYYQWCEYTTAAFTFSDSVFGCNFYLATGFHGFHVLLGVLFLAVCLIRIHERTPEHSLSLKLAVLYWHFVDLVWIGIYGIIYCWGSITAPPAWKSTADVQRMTLEILEDAQKERFKTEPEFLSNAQNQ